MWSMPPVAANVAWMRNLELSVRKRTCPPAVLLLNWMAPQSFDGMTCGSPLGKRVTVSGRFMGRRSYSLSVSNQWKPQSFMGASKGRCHATPSASAGLMAMAGSSSAMFFMMQIVVLGWKMNAKNRCLYITFINEKCKRKWRGAKCNDGVPAVGRCAVGIPPAPKFFR